MNFNLEKKELIKLLEEHPNSVIWSQKMDPGRVTPKFIYAIVSGILITLVILAIIYLFNSAKFAREMITDIIVLLFIVPPFYINYHIAFTLVYSIYPTGITFEWGLFKKKKVEIPFSDITAIELVTYSDKDISTIHLGTSKTYDIKKLDFDNHDSRPHITLEKIKNGKEVYELLKHLQDLARKQLTY